MFPADFFIEAQMLLFTCIDIRTLPEKQLFF